MLAEKIYEMFKFQLISFGRRRACLAALAHAAGLVLALTLGLGGASPQMLNALMLRDDQKRALGRG